LQFIGWAVVVLRILSIFVNTNINTIVAVVIGTAFAISGLLLIMGAQMVSATADTADIGRAILTELRKSQNLENTSE
jgi:hypothetical protein